jgi:hypothetical protein
MSIYDGYAVAAMNTTSPKKLHPVNVRMDDAMLAELRGIAAAENRSISNLIVTVLRDWLAARRAGGATSSADAGQTSRSNS